MGNRSVRLYVCFAHETHPATDWRKYKKFIKETYIDCVADAILENSEFEFDKEVTITVTSEIYGEPMTFEEKIYTYVDI